MCVVFWFSNPLIDKRKKNMRSITCMPPVSGYHAAPLVMPLSNDGVADLQATPRDIFAWLLAYVSDRCLKTSSSGVSDGCDA